MLDSYCVFLFCPATRHAIESACRCMFGVELVDMSLFYFLMYVQAAGGMDPLISAKPNMGQEFRVSVRICLMIFCNDQHLCVTDIVGIERFACTCEWALLLITLYLEAMWQGGAYHICEVLADTIGRDRIHLNQVVVQITQVHLVTLYRTVYRYIVIS